MISVWIAQEGIPSTPRECGQMCDTPTVINLNFSRHPHIIYVLCGANSTEHSRIAQLAERLTVNQNVAGSSPAAGASSRSLTGSFHIFISTPVSPITSPPIGFSHTTPHPTYTCRSAKPDLRKNRTHGRVKKGRKDLRKAWKDTKRDRT